MDGLKGKNASKAFDAHVFEAHPLFLNVRTHIKSILRRVKLPRRPCSDLVSIFEASNRDPVTINAFFRRRGIHLERAKRKKECKERQRVRDITAVPCEDTLPGKLSSVMTKFGYCENFN